MRYSGRCSIERAIVEVWGMDTSRMGMVGGDEHYHKKYPYSSMHRQLALELVQYLLSLSKKATQFSLMVIFPNIINIFKNGMSINIQLEHQGKYKI